MDKKEILDILDNAKDERGAVPMRLVRQAFDKLVQPEERTEKRTETHGVCLGTISRQAAVELAMKYCPDDDGTVQCDGDIRGLLDELENLPPAQPEEAIPVSWIEAKIARFMSMDNDFAGLTANIIKTMLNEWRKEARSEREHNK